MERVWDDYTRAVAELAGSGTVDVLAHPDTAASIPDPAHTEGLLA
ncbi:MAG TPA: hypothetical protein VGI64_16775 [Streptosporangiaceae bacterium]